MSKKAYGFTVVELMVVVVVIAILAAVSFVIYRGVQDSARNTQRESDIVAIVKSLEAYYAKNGSYPTSTSCGSTTINSTWCTSADASWQNFSTRMASVMSNVPSDPLSLTTTGSPIGTSNRYAYSYLSYNTEICGATNGQWYILYYKRSGGQIDRGDSCDTGTKPTARPAVSSYIGIKR